MSGPALTITRCDCDPVKFPKIPSIEKYTVLEVCIHVILLLYTHAGDLLHLIHLITHFILRQRVRVRLR